MKIRKKETSIGIVGKILNAFSSSKQDTYSADYINTIQNNTEDIINNKENKFIRGTNSITLTPNAMYLIACKPFTTSTESGGIGIVLGGYDIYWMGNAYMDISRNGNVYNITSSAGPVYIMAIPIQ